MIGKKYGTLTVISITPEKRSKARGAYVECACDCGNHTQVLAYNLKSGNTKSCGCRRFIRKYNSEGEVDFRLYTIWRNIKQRCLNPNNPNYKKYYGSRGIKVCDEWLDYLAFKAWALSHGYRDDLTIDRIDVNGNYEPSNCRWATYKVQVRNQRPRQKRS